MRTNWMKRVFALALAAVMAAALLCPAAAASAPWVQIDGKGTERQTVSLQGLAERYTGVQITLNLDRAAEGVDFEEAVEDDGQSYATARREGNSLTLYVTSKVFLNQGETLALGTLTADADFTVLSAAGLKLLSVAADPESGRELTVPEVSLDGSNVPDDPEPGSGPSGGSGSGTAARYAVKAASGIAGGTVRLSTDRAGKGQTVTVTATPDAGYTLRTVTVTADKTVAVTEQDDGTWTFTMPGCDVTVNAEFVPEERPLPFTDVGEQDWFREAVEYVYREGLMNGTGETVFSPGGTTTRGMVVTILHRYEGSPEAEPADFTDVPQERYYAGAVAWAAANGIVNGYDGGVFKPDQAITREQLAAILFRFAGSKGVDVSGRADLSAYTDREQISAYALDALAWANHAGLIGGVDEHTLRPQGPATRAQLATILMRFCMGPMRSSGPTKP